MSPRERASVGGDQVDDTRTRRQCEEVWAGRLPRWRDARDARAQLRVAGSIPGNHAQAAARQIRDAEAVGRPVGSAYRFAARERPVDAPTRLDREQLMAAPDADVEPARRPGRAAVAAEKAAAAIGVDDPDPVPGCDEHAPAAGQPRQR